MNANGATLDEVMEFKEIVAKLDEVGKNAILAIMLAMARGEDNETARSAGNAVLIAAGRKPIPPMC